MNFEYKRRPNPETVSETVYMDTASVGVTSPLSEAQVKKIVTQETAYLSKTVEKIKTDFYEVYFTVIGLVIFAFSISFYNYYQYTKLAAIQKTVSTLSKDIITLCNNDKQYAAYANKLGKALGDHLSASHVNVVDFATGFGICTIFALMILAAFATYPSKCDNGLDPAEVVKDFSTTTQVDFSTNYSSLWDRFPIFPKDFSDLESIYSFLLDLLKLIKDLKKLFDLYFPSPSYPGPYLPVDPEIYPTPSLIDLIMNQSTDMITESLFFANEFVPLFLFNLLDLLTKFF